MSYALIALHGKTFGVSDLPTSFVNTPILCTHADVRLYNAIQGRYSVEDAMQAMPHKTILPFTQRHLSMIKYLLGYDTLGNIITLCDAVRPCTFSALSLRHAVKSTPTVIECSFVSFLYDYESMFGDRCGRHGEDADVVAAEVKHTEGLPYPPLTTAQQEPGNGLYHADDEGNQRQREQGRCQGEGVETDRERAGQRDAQDDVGEDRKILRRDPAQPLDEKSDGDDEDQAAGPQEYVVHS